MARAPKKDATIYRRGRTTWAEVLEGVRAPLLAVPEVEVGDTEEDTKAAWANAKESGGLVFYGRLDASRRKTNASVESRSLLVLDADHVDALDLPDRVARLGCAAAVYATHSHTPEAPRWRVLVLPDRDLTRDEYALALRVIEYKLGLRGQFDKALETWSQAIFAPATADPEEYARQLAIVDGPPVQVADLLELGDLLGLAQGLPEVGAGDPTPCAPYDGPAYAEMTPRRREQIDAYVRGVEADWARRLAEAEGWEALVKDHKDRGWEAMTRDAAMAFAGHGVAAWAPGTVAEARKRFFEVLPEIMASDEKCAPAAKWKSAVRKAVEEPRLPPAGPEEDFTEEPLPPETEAPLANPLGLDLGRLREAEDAVFGATPRLEKVRQLARARLIGPWSVLGSVLARVLVETPVPVVLPPTIGSTASLNLGVAQVAQSGIGKSAGDSLAVELLDTVGDGEEASEALEARTLFGDRAESAGVGSGEGLVQSFLRWEKQEGTGSGEWRLRDRPHTFLLADEVGQLDAVGQRSGSTMFHVVRKALTGNELTTTAAAKDRNRKVPAKSYRFAMVVDVQPNLSDVLLNEHEASAGTPQRFLWLPSGDPWPDDSLSEPKGGLGWGGPDWSALGREYRVGVPAEAVKLVRETQKAKLRGHVGALDGHALLTRLKVAAALAFLHDERDITSQWWTLSGELMAISDMVRGACLRALAEKADADAARSGRRQGVAAALAEAAKAEQTAHINRRYALLVWKTVVAHAGEEAVSNRKHEADAGCTARCLSHAVRHHATKGISGPAMAELAESWSWIEERDGRWFPGQSAPKGAA
nr:hypothetical protein [Propionibacterium sp.]